MSSSTTQPRAKSCIECRQHKIKCDRLERHPEPCTRCTRRNLPCTYKAHFIREQRRPRSLHPKTQDGDANIPSPSTSTIPDPSESRSPTSLSISDQDHDYDPDQEQAYFTSQRHSEIWSRTNSLQLETLHSDLEAEPWPFAPYRGPNAEIGTISLSAEDINSHYTYFFTHMHIHFPFLDNPFSISSTLSTSPLLFWTIIVISASFKNRPLYIQLQPYVRTLLSQMLFPFRSSQEMVQALCLLCLWPLDSISPSDDPNFAYAGMATHIAMQLGLHRPDFIAEFRCIEQRQSSNSRSPRDRLATWCACVYVEHHLATTVGVPAGVRDSLSFQKYLKNSQAFDPPLPRSLRLQVLLAMLRNRNMNSIAWDGASASGLCDPTTRLNLLRAFTTELDQFHSRYGPLDVFTSILLHTSHITIAGFCLANDIISLNDHTEDKTTLLRRGITSASAVLDTIVPLEWETLPVHILRSLLNAGIYISQLLRIEGTTTETTLLPIRTQKSTSPLSDSPGTWSTSRSRSPAAQQQQQQQQQQSQSSKQPTTKATGVNLSQEETQHLINHIDRTIDILRSISYGQDFATRGKMVLEALRSHFPFSSPSPRSLSHSHSHSHSPNPQPVTTNNTNVNANISIAGNEEGSMELRAPSQEPDRSLEQEWQVPSFGTGVESGSGSGNGSGVSFQSRMGANVYWDAVEFGKERFNWNQNSRDILTEMRWELSANGIV